MKQNLLGALFGALAGALVCAISIGLGPLPWLSSHFAPSAKASQNPISLPTSGTLNGLQLVNDINNALDSVNTCNSGTAAPTNQLSGSPSAGNCWYNTTTGAVQFYDGSQWQAVGYIDATNHVFTPIIGGGAAASVASASTTNLCGSLGAAPIQSALNITGTASITSFGSNCAPGQMKLLSFAAAATIVYNATSMILPGATNIITNTGDMAFAVYQGSGNWQIAFYQPSSGSALINPAIDVGDVVMTFLTAPPSVKYLFAYGQPVSRTTYATLLAAITITQNVTRTNGSPILSGFSDTTQIPSGAAVEGTGIPTGTTISSCASTTCTMSANASLTGTNNVTVFPNGDGDGSTTFNLPDCRGVVFAGRDNMGGTARGKLSSTYALANPDALGVTLGGQSFTLTQGNLPSVNFIVSGTATINSSGFLFSNAGPLGGVSVVGSSSAGSSNSIPGFFATGTISGIAASGGSDTPISTVQPTLTANCMMRVLALLAPVEPSFPRLALDGDKFIADRIRRIAAS